MLTALWVVPAVAQQADSQSPADASSALSDWRPGKQSCSTARSTRPWKRAVSAGEFVQQDPVLGAEPTERTEVRFVFTQDHLYMGVICFDSEPDKLQGNTSKRDEFLSADDRFMWTIDTFLTSRPDISSR